MTYFNLDIIKQNLSPSFNNKKMFGEVNTPFSLIQKMLNLFPKDIFSNPNIKWLDPSAGYGYFSIILINLLMDGLSFHFPNKQKRISHILQNMVYMCEISETHCKHMRDFFGEQANIIHHDFLTYDFDNIKFDCIIGNPPYNSNGFKKVPTNNISSKKNDGQTLWNHFVCKSINILKPNGFLNFIIPSIWMKPDKLNMYNFITKHKIHFLHSFTNTQTKYIFKNQAQTPTCFFLLENTISDNSINLYDNIYHKYIAYNFQFNFIPLSGISILLKVFKKHNNNINTKLFFKKSNLPNNNISISNNKDLIFKYKNIKTCHLDKNTPKLICNFSDSPCKFFNEHKLVLSHKMYGFPYYDKYGEYGISNRDTYIIKMPQIKYDKSTSKYVKLSQNKIDKMYMNQLYFMQSKLVLFLYESTRYRMKFLERYIFDIIPNINFLSDFEDLNNKQIHLHNNYIYQYFNLTTEEIDYIEQFYSKDYNLCTI
jgi:tRNA1(Val) A37 N6-methylase TrmN6